MAFQATTDYFEIEVIPFDGKLLKLKPKCLLNGTKSGEITKAWSEVEKIYNTQDRSAKDSMTPSQLYGKQLSYVYDKSKEWWDENFDAGTIREILMYVAKGISGMEKNSQRSNQS